MRFVMVWLLAAALVGCHRPAADHRSYDWRDWHGSVFCPGQSHDDGNGVYSGSTVCAIWKLSYAPDKPQPGSVTCIADPYGGRTPGRLIAIDPVDPRLVNVEIGGGCL